MVVAIQSLGVGLVAGVDVQALDPQRDAGDDLQAARDRGVDLVAPGAAPELGDRGA